MRSHSTPINLASTTSITMTASSSSSQNLNALGTPAFDLISDRLESQKGNELSDDAKVHRFGNHDEPLPQIVSARQHLIRKMFLLSNFPIYFVVLLTLAFFLTQVALAFPALADLDFIVPTQWFVAIFISIVYCLVFHTIHRYVDRLERNNASLQVENGSLAEQCRNVERIETEHKALQAAHVQLQAENENSRAHSAQHQRQCEELQTVNIAVTAERDQFQVQNQAD